jgi:hypothetical protein
MDFCSSDIFEEILVQAIDVFSRKLNMIPGRQTNIEAPMERDNHSPFVA